MLSAILLEAGVPSVITRTAGFDVPEFLAAGPRDVLVAQSGLEAARAVLHGSGLDRPTEAASPATPRRVAALAAAIFTAVCITALVAWILTATPR